MSNARNPGCGTQCHVSGTECRSFGKGHKSGLFGFFWGRKGGKIGGRDPRLGPGASGTFSSVPGWLSRSDQWVRFTAVGEWPLL